MYLEHVTTPETSTAAGLTLVAVLSAAAVGAAVAGPAGAGAGLLLAGGARNTYSAARGLSSPSPEEQYEVGKTGIVGLAQLGVGAWLAYYAATRSER